MTLLDILGFDTGLITSTLANSEFDAVSTVTGGTITAGGSRVPSPICLQVSTGGTNGVEYGERDWGSDQDTVYNSFWTYFPVVPTAVTGFFAYYDSTSAAISHLVVTSSGYWGFANAGDMITYVSSGNAVIANHWYHIETKLYANNGAGTIDWKTDGILEPGISGLTSKNTKPGGSPRKYRVGVTLAQTNAGTRYLEDIVIRTDGWIGNAVVRPLPFSADTLHNWTITDAGTTAGHRTQVDYSWPTTPTTDFISSSTANQEERWRLGKIAEDNSNLTIFGVLPTIRLRRGVAGSAAGVTLCIRSGASDGTASSSIDAGSATWTTRRGVIQETDPATATAWTASGINNAELKILHDAGTNEVRISNSLVYAAYAMAPASGTVVDTDYGPTTKAVAIKLAEKYDIIKSDRYKKRGRNSHFSII